jgi:SAM-dependent methyltransferase
MHSQNIPRKNPKSYVKVKSQSLYRLTLFNAQDTKNGTKTKRNCCDYAKCLGLKVSLKDYIIELALEKKRKISILDSGCGSGVAIDELLSDNELKNYIQHISGISMHYFENIESVLKKHGSRFTYYSGTAQNVLAKAAETSNEFDLIFDLFGAYAYSSDKLNLLKQYHQSLKPFGIARIFQQADDDLHLEFEKSRCNFLEWMASNHSKTFTFEHVSNHSMIVINKSSLRWPIPKYNIVSSEEKPVSSKPRPLEWYRERNALKIAEVVEKPKYDQAIQLRPLVFRK